PRRPAPSCLPPAAAAHTSPAARLMRRSARLACCPRPRHRRLCRPGASSQSSARLLGLIRL
ncbi:hypothetical protein HK405_007559, partial [Cladochytrium tenue]